LAHLEAGFDFADEDLPFVTAEELDRKLTAASETVSGLVRQMISRTDSTELVRVVLTGWPNTGKSSLFNALLESCIATSAHRARTIAGPPGLRAQHASGKTGALVSEQAGTTRDYLTAEMDVQGARFLLIDTAGVQSVAEAAADELHGATQAATNEQTRAAHIRLLCLDSTRPLNPWEHDQLLTVAAGRLLVLTKCDAQPNTDFGGHAIATSSVTGAGLDVLHQRIREAVLTARTSDADVVAGTAVRCGESLRLAAGCLQRARRLVRTAGGEELVAAEIRVALDELGKVVGAVYTDDVLDRVFSRFCIGK
jgi:tRNA modification GTPase